MREELTFKASLRNCTPSSPTPDASLVYVVTITIQNAYKKDLIGESVILVFRNSLNHFTFSAPTLLSVCRSV